MTLGSPENTDLASELSRLGIKIVGLPELAGYTEQEVAGLRCLSLP